MSNCVQCTSDPLPPCSCAANQECVRINQSCDQCAHNVCQSLDGSSGGGSNVGATAGGAVGGAAAGIIVVTLLWYFYKRRRGSSINLGSLFSSHMGDHHLKHSRSISRDLGLHEMGTIAEEEEEEQPSRPVSRALDNRASRLSKRVSIHADKADDQPADSPFADEAPQRNSVRASKLTPISSLVYLPPDANSMSLEDGHVRSVLGEKRKSGQPGAVMPASQALALPTIKTTAPVPTIKTPPIKPVSLPKPKAKPVPLRPTRDPGLDLVLPTPSPRTPDSTSTPTASTPTIKVEDPDSRFSSSTWATGYSGLRSEGLTSPTDARPGSTFSAVSAASHASYLIDPPKVVMIGGAGAQRVEMIRADPVMLPTQPKSPGAQDPFADVASDGLQEAMAQIADLDAAHPNDELQDAIQQIGRLDAARPADALEDAMQRIADLNASQSGPHRGSTVSVTDSNRSTLFPSDSSSVRAPSTASFSLLDGIPFMSGGPQQRASSADQTGTFPMPPIRASTAEQSRPTSAASFATTNAAWANRAPQSVMLEPLPQGRAISLAASASRPSSGLTDVGAATRRSGFSSGGALADVPFQLAFPGERNSTASTTRMSGFSEMPEMATGRSSLAGQGTEDPFTDASSELVGEVQAVGAGATTDSRLSAAPSAGHTSMASLAELAATFVDA